MRISYHKCIVGDHLLFYLGTQKMQKSYHDYIVGKHFSNLDTQKGANSSKKSTTRHHSFLFGHSNKYAKFLLGDAKKKSK
jgi:hypothetical protein